MKRKNLVLIIVVLQLIGCASSKEVSYELINPRKINSITAGKVDTLRKYINSIHPNIYLGIDTLLVDSVANKIVSDNKSKLLTNPDFTLEMRRLTDLFNYVDPHLIYAPYIQLDSGFVGKYEDIKMLPFEVYNINDTLLIKRSFSPKLQRGDRLLSINGSGIDKFIKYIYPTWRSIEGYVMQLQTQFSYSENYDIVVNRRGKVEEFTVEGVGPNHVSNERYCTGYIIDKYKTGYAKISSFTNNKFIYKELKKQIKATKERGYTNFIIDLRGNPGGSGYKIEDMFSLMSDKDSILCQKSVFIKVSSVTKKDYKFLKEHKKGELVKFPDNLMFKHVPLDKDLYQGEMNYYLMIDRSTASSAASFANIIQYNDMATLVGESLDHNSLNFGDVINAWAYQGILISTVQYNDYTKSVDGVLTPEIEIPYVAKEHMESFDPILDKLLIKIKEGQNE